MIASHARWLSIIGVGEDGLDGLSPAARSLLSQARLIVGGARHLALIGPTSAETLVWPSPLERGIDMIRARRGQPVSVLASGDPFLYGVGSVLTAAIPAQETICVPAPSSLSLAAARLGWALQDCEVVSLHGRPLQKIIPHLRARARILALSWDETTPGKLAALLVARGFGAAQLTTMEALGGPRERLCAERADRFDPRARDRLNLVAVEIGEAEGVSFVPLTSGLPEDCFEHDGQITKREVRAITLSALAPFPGGRLWDVGAGSGSVGIEWMLSDPRNRAWAVEAREERAARIARNAEAFGVPDLVVVTGTAPQALADLPSADAIFVGGGGVEVIDAAWRLLPKGRRFVAHAVTLETQSVLSDRHARWGGSLISIAISRADPLGPHRGWKPGMPVVQWTAVKP